MTAEELDALCERVKELNLQLGTFIHDLDWWTALADIDGPEILELCGEAAQGRRDESAGRVDRAAKELSSVLKRRVESVLEKDLIPAAKPVQEAVYKMLTALTALRSAVPTTLRR